MIVHPHVPEIEGAQVGPAVVPSLQSWDAISGRGPVQSVAAQVGGVVGQLVMTQPHLPFVLGSHVGPAVVPSAQIWVGMPSAGPHARGSQVGGPGGGGGGLGDGQVVIVQPHVPLALRPHVGPAVVPSAQICEAIIGAGPHSVFVQSVAFPPPEPPPTVPPPLPMPPSSSDDEPAESSGALLHATRGRLMATRKSADRRFMIISRGRTPFGVSDDSKGEWRGRRRPVTKTITRAHFSIDLTLCASRYAPRPSRGSGCLA